MFIVKTGQLFTSAQCMVCDGDHAVVGIGVTTSDVEVERWFVCRTCLTTKPISLREVLGSRTAELRELTEWLARETVESTQAPTLLEWNEQLRRFRKDVRRQNVS